MNECSTEAAVELIRQHTAITFLTGAGISTPSGVPDYRSLKGVYHGLEAPEYLLSRSCLIREPEKFYGFVKKLYHPDAEPNAIHYVMAALENKKKSLVISQNIDGLHQKAGSRNLINFHGSLYDCFCEKCGENIDWHDYLSSFHHEGCGGTLRPAIVLYEEGFSEDVIQSAVTGVAAADLIVIVGTSFQVAPFCRLIDYRKNNAKVLVVNQTPFDLPVEADFVQADALEVFKKIEKTR